MKIRVLAMLVGIIISTSAICQDYIYLNNGDRIEAVVTEQTKTAVIYQIFGNSQEGIKLVNKTDIKMIAFSNGKIENFGNEVDFKVKSKEDFTKNLFAYHLADLLINNFTISYERILNSGKVGLQIPFSVGYEGDYEELGDFQNKYYTGLYLNFYPTGQGKWRFFLGPGIRVGQGHIEEYYYDYNTGNDYYKNEDAFYFKFHLNNGVIFSPIDELSIAASVSLGLRYVDSDLLDNKMRTTGAASFNMIYRF